MISLQCTVDHEPVEGKARMMISRVRAPCAGRQCSALLGGGERLEDKVQWSVKLTTPFNPRLLSPSNGV